MRSLTNAEKQWEESGGITIWEFMAKTGKSLHELIQEVYAIAGTFCFKHNDSHIDDTKIKYLAIAKAIPTKPLANTP
jgi:hypothetical protein